MEELGVEEFSRVERVDRAERQTSNIKHQTIKPRVLLVTSAWHMKRARLMFEKYATEIEVVCAPTDFENTYMAGKTTLFKMLLPDPNVFYLNFTAFHEWVGIAGYKVFR